MNSPSPVKTLLVLALAAIALVFSNCSTPGEPEARATRKHKAAVTIDDPPPDVTPPAKAIRPPGVDRKARVATLMTPDQVLQLAHDCAVANQSNLHDFAVTGVSLNLNLGLQPEANQPTMTWVVSFRETGEKDGKASTDADFWVYVDDTTHSAKYRRVP